MVTSDASGQWGCGAYWLLHWFQLQWPTDLQDCSIQVKEMAPVVLAAALFGQSWRGKRVQFTVDNEAVVAILCKSYSRDTHLMHLVRVLVFFAAYFGFNFGAKHIAGVNNKWADAISRNNLSLFLLQASTGVEPVVPAQLVNLVTMRQAWVSTDWTPIFNNIIMLD